MIVEQVETTSPKAAAVKYKKSWLVLRTERSIDCNAIWMFIDGSSSGWHAALIFDPFGKTATRIARFRKPESRNIGPELWSLLVGLNEVVDPQRPLVVVHDYIGTGAWLAGAWQIKSDNVRRAVDQIRQLIESRGFVSIKFIHHGGHQKDESDFTSLNNIVDQLCTGQEEVYEKGPWDWESR